ncbi:MAG: response regulator transcription factor [Candidatus Dactylopiibacterium sp.]|nr:response regulator transcription factor [Candidatus Dactylopiibacterium sp.]
MPLPARTHRIHLIENDASQRERMLGALAEAGFDASGFSDAPAFYRSLVSRPCHMAVVSVDLPGEDGYAVARHLRAAGGMGVVLLTVRDGVDERIRSLRDADAYLSKPFEMRELIAVLTSLDRRLALSGHRGYELSGAGHATWSLMDSGWTLQSSLGLRIPLTRSERTFLEALVDQSGQVVSRESLAERMSGDGNVAEYDLHRLEALVSRLRRKAHELGAELPIRAVRGLGYLFVARTP